VLLTLCSVCSLRYVPNASMSIAWVLRYVPYVCMSKVWVLQCSLENVPYAYNSNEWVLLTHCFCRSAPYAMLLMLEGQMHGNFLRTALERIFSMCGCYLRTAFGGVLLTLYSLCLYVKGVSAAVVLTICSLCLYVK